MSVGWCARVLRAAVFAAVCVLLAALGHVMMSGHDVPWWAIAAGTATTGIAGWFLAGRERGLPLIVSVSVAAQTSLHWAFSLAQSAVEGATEPMAGGRAPSNMVCMGNGADSMKNMSMDHMSVDHAATGHASMGHMESMGHMDMTSMDMGSMGHMGHSMSGSAGFGMFAAHLLAAILSGLWLAHGERAAFRILRSVAGWLAAPLRPLLASPPPSPHRPRVRVRRRRSDRSPRQLLLVRSITSRGPPLGTAVA
ncbi:hypothetical protein [Streptomyces sp. HUAS TT7]|uniref:hypothetical protein n=1 Tax=Streptomyces sp. HUAS TT7 TaxID=3447507 RepID=UPI003F65BCA3